VRPSQEQTSMCKEAAYSIETSVYICVCTMLGIHFQQLKWLLFLHIVAIGQLRL